MSRSRARPQGPDRGGAWGGAWLEEGYKGKQLGKTGQPWGGQELFKEAGQSLATFEDVVGLAL